MCDELLVSG